MEQKKKEGLKKIGSVIAGGVVLGGVALIDSKLKKWKEQHPGIAAKGEYVMVHDESCGLKKGAVYTVARYGDKECTRYIFNEIEPELAYAPYLGEKYWNTLEFPASAFRIVMWDSVYPNIAEIGKKVIAQKDVVMCGVICKKNEEIIDKNASITIRAGEVLTVNGYGSLERNTYHFKEVEKINGVNVITYTKISCAAEFPANEFVKVI